MEITENQQNILDGLLSGLLTLKQFNTKRSAARRYRHLQKSIDYAVAYEIYKDNMKDED